MTGRRHAAGPGEPRCPRCERPAGLFTDHEGSGPCRRHDTAAAAPRAPDALSRRLTGGEGSAEPLALVRVLLRAARRAEFPFEQAWAIAVEAALSHLTPREARRWLGVLDASHDAWNAAYHDDRKRLAELLTTARE